MIYVRNFQMRFSVSNLPVQDIRPVYQYNNKVKIQLWIKITTLLLPNAPRSPRSLKVRKFPCDKGGVVFCKATKCCSCKFLRFSRAVGKNRLNFSRVMAMLKILNDLTSRFSFDDRLLLKQNIRYAVQHLQWKEWTD